MYDSVECKQNDLIFVCNDDYALTYEEKKMKGRREGERKKK